MQKLFPTKIISIHLKCLHLTGKRGNGTKVKLYELTNKVDSDSNGILKKDFERQIKKKKAAKIVQLTCEESFYEKKL